LSGGLIILKKVLNWIFVDKCAVCAREISPDAFLCTECFCKLTFIDVSHCKRCGKLLEILYDEENLCRICASEERYFDSGRSLLDYNDYSSKIVMKIKKKADEGVAQKCAQMLFGRYKNIIREVDLIVPTPSHFCRILRRGFNPATIIAKYISIASGIDMNVKILKRVKKTEYQKGKTFEERQRNVDKAFALTKKLHGENILIVDDVMTTGATISACAKTLKEHGAGIVNFVTVASTRGLSCIFVLLSVLL
jgi:ComF family protein